MWLGVKKHARRLRKWRQESKTETKSTNQQPICVQVSFCGSVGIFVFRMVAFFVGWLKDIHTYVCTYVYVL